MNISTILFVCAANAGFADKETIVDQFDFDDGFTNDVPYSSESETVSKAMDPSPQANSNEDRIEQMHLELGIEEEYIQGLAHGEKPSQFQKYIVLHDTEGDSSPEDVVSWWDSNGNLVAAHFVIGKDGRIVQCVPLDQIAHHAGYGDTEGNEKFDILEDGRDDMLGSQPIGSAYPDYGMNAWSIGIELVHIGGAEEYPLAQLEALDKLIAYLDAVYYDSPSGNAGKIIDHKAWRTSNPDTSSEFTEYLVNYQEKRKHG